MKKNCVICGKEFDTPKTALTSGTACKKERLLKYSKKWYSKNSKKRIDSTLKSRAKRVMADPENAKAASHIAYHKWYSKNLDKIRESARNRYALNFERISELRRICHAKNPEITKRHYATWLSKNPYEHRARSRIWYHANRQRLISQKVVYQRFRYKNDEIFKLKSQLRSRLYNALRSQGASKSASTKDLTGCADKFLCDYIELLFKPGMSWANRNLWHVDHIYPCAAFDLTDPQQQRDCFHWTNLQPLWATENIIKGAKII